MSKKQPQKNQKLQFKSYTHPKFIYVGKVPKLLFENLTQKLIDFKTFFVGKVPKSSVYNRECLENSEFFN